MSAVLRALRSPGALRDVVASAPSIVSKTSHELEDLDNAPGYIPEVKPRVLDRWLDKVVEASGSVPVFVFVQALLLAWAFLGISFNQSYIWPVVMSNAQAIFSYVFDSFLMRQQLNSYQESLTVAAELKSRSCSSGRMLAAVADRVKGDMDGVVWLMEHKTAVSRSLPQEDRFTKVITRASHMLGHIYFVAFYWLSIIVWLAFGPLNGWSNQWQLDINSATSALMVFVFSFLAIVRERHSAYLRACVDAIYRVDSVLEARLRELTDDDLSNPEIVILAPKIGTTQRIINYYADVVGTLVGIALLFVVLVVWLALGPALQFDANWWLIIGTYAGLIGLNDGFVLRNVQALFRQHESIPYAEISAADEEIFRRLGLTAPSSASCKKHALSYRASEAMNRVCGHEITVVVGVLFIVGLLVGSSLMHWSETGQLLCNIPPSVIESFFMIILITGHNAADKQSRIDLTNVFDRRCKLLSFASAVKEFSRANHSPAMGDEKSRSEVVGEELKTIDE